MADTSDSPGSLLNRFRDAVNAEPRDIDKVRDELRDEFWVNVGWHAR